MVICGGGLRVEGAGVDEVAMERRVVGEGGRGGHERDEAVQMLQVTFPVQFRPYQTV